MAVETLLASVFEAADQSDIDRFCRHLHPDVRFRFGNADAVHGRDAVRELLSFFYSAIGGLEHTISEIVHNDGQVFCHGQVRYERLDGSHLTCPFAN